MAGPGQAAIGMGASAVQWLMGTKMGKWLIPLGLGGAALSASDNIIGSVRNAVGASGAVGGPGGIASNTVENATQTELFSKTTSGVRNFFVGIMEFFKVIGDLFKGKISLGAIMSGDISASEAFSSAQARKQDDRVGGLTVSGPALGTAAAIGGGVIATGYGAYKGVGWLRGRGGPGDGGGTPTHGGDAPRGGGDGPSIRTVNAADDVARAAEKAAGVGGHGRGKAALLLGGAVIGGSILSQTFAGSAEAGTPDGATITADNTNAAPTSALGEAAHKTHVLAHGVQSGLVSLGGSLEDAWDMTDNLMGGWLPGDDQKNSTATFLGNAADSFLISKPEIRGAFDQAVHGAGEMATWLIPVGAAAKGIGAGARTVTALRTMEQAENVVGVTSIGQAAANLVFRPN